MRVEIVVVSSFADSAMVVGPEVRRKIDSDMGAHERETKGQRANAQADIRGWCESEDTSGKHKKQQGDEETRRLIMESVCAAYGMPYATCGLGYSRLACRRFFLHGDPGPGASGKYCRSTNRDLRPEEFESVNCFYSGSILLIDSYSFASIMYYFVDFRTPRHHHTCWHHTCR